MRRAALLAALVLATLAWAAGPPVREPEEVTKGIAQLADADPAVRRAALARLEALGEPAAAPLRRLGGDSRADLDVRLRAHAVAGAIEAKLYGELRTFTGHTDGVIAVAASPDGATLASGAWLGGADHLIRLWDVKTGKNTRSLTGHTGVVVAVAFLPGGKRLLSGGGDRVMRLWDLPKGALIRRVAAHAPCAHGVAYSPDGKRVVSCGYDNAVRLWDADTGEALQTMEGHTNWALGVAFLPDGRHAVSASYDKTLRLWGLRR